jgi:hypothetical protein
MSAPSATKKSLNLPAPDFTIDENDNNLELFTIRLPVKVPLSSLNDLVLDMKDESTTATFTANGQDYRIQMGDAIENESFRVLVPRPKGDDDDEEKEKDSDDEDSVENENKKSKHLHYLQPSSQAFSKHFNVFASVPHLSETQLAPREGPPAVDKMRHAYAPIAQRSGLKRRWMPLGVPKPTKDGSSKKEKKKKTSKSKESSSPVDMETEDTPLPPTKRIKTEESDKSSSKADKKAKKAEKKAMKAEKKSAKKAKKDAKKSKKVKTEE